MEIQFAILGLLSWQSFSGYDLKKIMAESEVFFWSGNNNQIYNSLIALHKEGLVTQEVIVQESLPAKKVYSITESGREKLHAWLRASPELPELHNHFLIQLAWADALPAGELDDLLARYEEEIRVQYRMRQVQAERAASVPQRTPRERFLWRSILENLAGVYRRELEWVRQVREELEKNQWR